MKHEVFHDTHRLFSGHYEQSAEGIPNFTFCVICCCYSSQNAVGLKNVCKGTRASKTTIRTRLANKMHPISKKPIVGIHRVFSGVDTRAFAATVASIVDNSSIPDGIVQNDGVGLLPNPVPSNDAERLGSFFDDSEDCAEEEDPFLEFAHS
jgi:hypothetical protein